MIKAIYVVTPLFILAACASLTQEQCTNGNWNGIGYQDGVDGLSQSYFKRHRDACGEYGITPDKTAWLAGRAEGLKQYCTKPNAYAIGRSGAEMNPVCTTNVDSLRLSNFYGLRYFQITEQISADQKEINTLVALLAADTGTLPPDTKQYYRTRINVLQAEIFTLINQRAQFVAPPSQQG